MVVDIPRGYRANAARWWHTLSDPQAATIVSCLVGGIWTRHALLMLAVSALVLAIPEWKLVAPVCVVAAIVGCVLGTKSWNDAHPRRLGQFSGVARLMTDPTPRSGAVQVIFEIDGQRYETWAWGSPKRRLANLLAGDQVWVSGALVALSGTPQHRAAIRHVVGKFDADAIGDVFPGSPFDQASNRVRRLLAEGAKSLRSPEDALFAGLVIGDDRYEPPEMIQQFRSSGMSHLTAVSGQNVAFVLAAAAPLLRRLRASWRWLATLGLIIWFIALTRFEPSVLRAGCMAAISATGYLLGRERPPSRVLPLAVGGLVAIDPMLVWSVGFWLSIGATAGVSLIGPRVAPLLPGPQWLRDPLSITIGAQIGVAPVSLMVFGSLPIVSVPANLLAVPVAGFVMLYGLPAGILAGTLPQWAAAIVQFPSAIGTRWVAIVANLASRIEPAAPWPACGWTIVAIAFGLRWFRRWLNPDAAHAAANTGSEPAAEPSTARRQ
jgi:competence protein ComEC